MTKDIVQPKEFLGFVEHETHGDRNKSILNKKKVIWVMGENQSTTIEQIVEWQDIVQSIGVAPANIHVVDLTKA